MRAVAYVFDSLAVRYVTVRLDPAIREARDKLASCYGYFCFSLRVASWSLLAFQSNCIRGIYRELSTLTRCDVL